MYQEFLQPHSGRPWSYDRADAELEFYQGKGSSALEIVVVGHGERPNKEFLQRTYTDRRGGRVNPILVVALYGDKVGLCGPSGEDPPVFRDVDRGQAERVCDAALEKPDRHVAQSFLSNTLPQLDEELAGLRNQGLLSTHELRVGVPERDDWDRASEQARQALTDDPRELVEGLDYEVDRLTDQSYVLKDNSNGHERAVAMFLQEDESFDRKQDRFVNKSPVAYALNEADKRNLDYVIGSSGDTLRLYTTNPEAGFGSRGRTDTYVEVNTNLLADEKAAYLWLLFSAGALQDDGSLHQIMEDSKEYAAKLGGRLQNRIYDEVIPDLAEAIADARDIDNPTKKQLDQTYEMALFLLYRLLFIAYAEDEEFLPRRRNGRYDQHSLKQKAHDLHELVQEGREFDDSFYDHWDNVMRLSRAIHNGHEELGLPAYEGRILSEDADVSEAGARLADIRLNNAEFGPVLFRLLIDENEDGYQGPVDFRNIGVREFGVIYEGLLESELSVAEQPLTTDEEDHYQPIESGAQQTLGDNSEDVVVQEGEVYLHGQSGERKATGAYYTKSRFVEHLLNNSLDPALDDHIERIERLREEEGENAAARAFFDIRVSDIAMGSGHFLVGAVDRIESRLYKYLTENPLTPVQQELDNLEDAALSAFDNEEYAPNIERGQLLRRQVARRCIYGADLNPLSTELARLSIWVHTFVPGLPLTFLDYNLVTGDSLAGIGTLDEIAEEFGANPSRIGWGLFPELEDTMGEISDEIEQIGRRADSDAEQVREARGTRADIEEKLAQVEARFDILAASRVDDDIDTEGILDTSIENVTDLPSYEKAQEVLDSTDPLHFPVAFPELFTGEDNGFDTIVGNPPWEEATLEEKEFWARYIPNFQAKSDELQKELRDDLVNNRPELLEKYKTEKERKQKTAEIIKSGPYESSSGGGSAPELFVSFLSRFNQLVGNSGHVGAVVPRTAFSGDNTTAFRENLFNNYRIDDLTVLVNNNNWVFDSVHGQKTIALACYEKTGEPTDVVPLQGPFYSLEEYEDGIKNPPHEFDLETIRSLNSALVIPLPPTKEAVDIFDRMVSNNKKFDYKDGDWRAVPVTPLKLAPYEDEVMDDGTTLLHRSESPPEDDFIPVVGGKCIDFWKYDESKVSVWSDPDLIYHYLQEKRETSYEYAGSRSPFSDMPEDWVYDKSTLPCYSSRVVFRDSTNKTNTRTVIPALVPPNVAMLDTAPYLIWPKGDEKDQAYLMGIMGSIPFDWCARTFVESHVSFYLLRGLPVPRVSGENQLRDRIVELSGSLAANNQRYSKWSDAVGVDYGSIPEERRQEMMYEIDAVAAHLYGLTREHVEVMFETFHDGWNYEERLERVLDYYASWADRLNLDHTDREAEQAAGTRNDD